MSIRIRVDIEPHEVAVALANGLTVYAEVNGGHYRILSDRIAQAMARANGAKFYVIDTIERE